MLSEEKKDEVRTKVTETLYHTAEKKQLSRKITNKAIRMIQHIFNKDPKKKDNKCMLCEDDD